MEDHTDPRHHSRSRRRRLPAGPGVAAGVALALAGLAGLAWTVHESLLRPQVRVVVASELYRSGQLEPEGLRAAVGELGLRSVLNLRGAAPGSAWYESERREASALGVRHVDLRMSADRLPSRSELARLVRLLDGLERPLLFHCLGGRDRSGLAEALVVLLAGGGLEEARDATRLSLGGLEIGRSPLADFVDQYVAWLRSRGLEHSGARAREYALVHYVPGPYAAELTLLSFPDRFVAAEPYTARFRVENRSPRAWQLTDGRSDRGVHLGLRIERLSPGPMPPCEGRADTADGTVGPGEALELAMNLPRLEAPGTYRLHFDMVNESEAWFADRGVSRPVVREIVVRERPADAPPAEPGGDFVTCELPQGAPARVTRR